jgi:hypothetical protein
MHPGKLEKQVDSLLKDKADIAICQTYMRTSDGRKYLHTDGRISSDNYLVDYSIYRNLGIVTNSVLFRKEFIKANEIKWDEDLSIAQEWDFLTKAFSSDPIITTVLEPLHENRIHDQRIKKLGRTKEDIYRSHVMAAQNFFDSTKINKQDKQLYLKNLKPLIIALIQLNYRKTLAELIVMLQNIDLRTLYKLYLILVLHLIIKISHAHKPSAIRLTKLIL